MSETLITNITFIWTFSYKGPFVSSQIIISSKCLFTYITFIWLFICMLPVWFLLCRANWVILLKVVLQISHSYYISLVWISLWSAKYQLRVKDLLQISHTYGLYSVWFLLWVVKLSFLANIKYFYSYHLIWFLNLLNKSLSTYITQKRIICLQEK